MTAASAPARRTAAEIEEFITAVFSRAGAGEPVAREVARHLVRASASGHDSHGVIRVARYIKGIDDGKLDPRAHPVVLRERGAGAVIDARTTFGIYSTGFALTWALAAARTHGLGAAAIRHSTHIGRLGEYAERAAREGMIAILTVGFAGPGLGGVVPFGGKRPFLSTNPWAIGIPSASGEPFVFDAATSAIPEGKVMVAIAKGQPLPPGAIVDRDGNPSTDPNDHRAGGGALLPLGGEIFGYKGFGLSLASALIGGLAMIDDEEPTIPAGTGKAPKRPGVIAGVFVLAVDPALFGPPERYAQLVAETIAALHEVEPRAGARIVASGEPEAQSRARREREGIEIPAKTMAQLHELAARFHIPHL